MVDNLFYTTLIKLGVGGIFILVLLRMVLVLYRENRDLYERVVRLEQSYSQRMQRTSELLNRLVAKLSERLDADAKRHAIDSFNEITPRLPAHLEPSRSPEPLVLNPHEDPHVDPENPDQNRDKP